MFLFILHYRYYLFIQFIFIYILNLRQLCVFFTFNKFHLSMQINISLHVMATTNLPVHIFSILDVSVYFSQQISFIYPVHYYMMCILHIQISFIHAIFLHIYMMATTNSPASSSSLCLASLSCVSIFKVWPITLNHCRFTLTQTTNKQK